MEKIWKTVRTERRTVRRANIFDGNDIETIYKIQEKNGKTRIIRDLKAGIFELIEQKKSYASLWDQTKEERDAISAKKRRNVFKMPYCTDQMRDADFLLTVEKARSEGLIRFPADVYRSVSTWSAATPLENALKKPRAFYIAGPPGIGKTLFCKLHAISLYDAEGSIDPTRTGLVRYISMQDFINAYMRASNDDKSSLTAEFKSCKYLYIDDIGSQYATDFNLSFLKQLLESRAYQKYQDGQRTWTFFNSNFRVKDLGYPEPILHRISELAVEVIAGEPLEKSVRLPRD